MMGKLMHTQSASAYQAYFCTANMFPGPSEVSVWISFDTAVCMSFRQKFGKVHPDLCEFMAEDRSR